LSPSNLLFDATDVRLDLDADETSLALIVQHDIDPATRRLPHADFRRWSPARVDDREQRLLDPRLVPVADQRASVGVEASCQVSPKRDSQLRVCLEGRVRLPCEDPR
jgi:hypothetical protein